MRLLLELGLALVASQLQLCSAIPYSTPEAPTLEPRFVNLLTADEKSILQKQTIKCTSSQGTTSPPPALLPNYPSSSTNPVDPNSWLMQYARSSKVTPFWNFTETLYAPCQRHRQPIPKPCTRPPNCEDVHSLTHLNLFTGTCENMKLLYARICTFATFVLPDSQCPGRVNSYSIRCPQSMDEFLVIGGIDDTDHRYHNLSNLANAIEQESIPTPEQCTRQGITPLVPGPGLQPNETAIHSRRSSATDMSLRGPTALTTAPRVEARHVLKKRGYKYRKYLDSKNLYRSYSFDGPQEPIPDIPMEDREVWSCYDREGMSQMENVFLNGTLVEICWYPLGTGRYWNRPEERCPGMRSADACPNNDEELVNAILESCKISCKKWASKEKIRELLEMEEKRDPENPPCNADNPDAHEFCIRPTPVDDP